MPMVLLTVPPTGRHGRHQEATEKIIAAARREGVKGGITVWPIPLATKSDRLLLEYKSRQEVENPNRLAQVLAEAANEVYNLQVEAAIIKLDSATTGLHITPK